ncbi:hypothetical protein HDU87_002565 [Geranomyces variabilis]|uniref:Uncharacterized protein n=1 Tax=Geranomyces variabilis TaxID=109894 RepID=A0AAD5XUP6_9FUNG|nr:hypothetical protein HDU87_002565 [Geranomyces variabilis]
MRPLLSVGWGSSKKQKSPFHGGSHDSLAPNVPLLNYTELKPECERVNGQSGRASGLFSKGFPSWRGKSSCAVSGKAEHAASEPRQSTLQLTLVEFLDSSTSVNALSGPEDAQSYRPHHSKENLIKPEHSASYLVEAPASPAVKKAMRRMSSWFARSGSAAAMPRNDGTGEVTTPPSKRVSPQLLSRKEEQNPTSGPPTLRRCQSEARSTPHALRNSLASAPQTDPPSASLGRTKSIRRSRELAEISGDDKNHGLISFPPSPPVPTIPATYRSESPHSEHFPFVPTSSPLPPGPVSARHAINARMIRASAGGRLCHHYAWDAERDGWILVTRSPSGEKVSEEFVGRFLI